jgi:ATP-dependent DNA helicase PIF1
MTQSEALAILEAGQSVLLTGAAGTGKTYVLNQFIRRAKRRGWSVAVTATTGLAATHLNGTTIHAWSGIGVKDAMDEHMAAGLSASRQDLIRKADVLIIDEISMLHDFRLDMVDLVLRTVREREAPFGGMQVVLCGDFFQLPPVNRSGERGGGFVVGANAWRPDVFRVCYLEQQYRQSDDEAYAAILNGIRSGVLTRAQLESLRARTGAAGDPLATRLLTVNVDVDQVNAAQLDRLDSEVHEYQMETHGGKKYIEQLRRSCLAMEVLRLKLGAQVMCIRNAQDRRYANGSLGRVVGFEDGTGWPVVELVSGRTTVIGPETWELMDGDKRRASLMQVPLRLAWAITVHKSQGMTLDAARIDLSRAFVEGMGYVALSRVRGLQHLVLDGLGGMALRVSPQAKDIDVQLRAASEQARQDFAAEIEQWQADEASGAHEAADQARAAVLGVDPTLLEGLKAWRRERARELEIPPYLIAHDKTLELVAARKPDSESALLGVAGFGSKKVAAYGADIIRIVKETAGA